MVDNTRNEQYGLIVMLLKKYQFLDDTKMKIWFDICCCCGSDTEFLYRIYDSLNNKMTDTIQSYNKKAEYSVCADDYILKCGGQQIKHSYDELISLVPSLIGVLQEILPLGSVVEINPAYKNPKENTTEHFQMVITHRYISPDKDDNFFEYAGVPYPTGMLQGDKMLFFTQRSIRKVIHKGYSDIRDRKFIMAVKKALIIDKGTYSVSFTDKYKNQFFKNDKKG